MPPDRFLPAGGVCCRAEASPLMYACEGGGIHGTRRIFVICVNQ